ncbi:glycerophosphodiester phosphodiesterase family protein [Pedobacter sp. BS3]|uniref:glycerophosphodiester phosphodiesterase family protein n=1 Tax=Pedobacter sp. BS3 TaxID=2567937 RepID=UPI0011EC0261|nr:glycerophosphodiester phosphodiesterase family protein [Pedobacter sp. BS3]TZF81343.1 glycerophosphodiester phosphodiesterase family protein [Pedobacter sp. BS3]
MLQINNTTELKEFFHYSDNRVPLICAHRGGARAGYPENAIATFEHTLTRMHAFFEVDPRLTKDGEIVAFHDETLDRTTNGTGKLTDYTWDEVKQLKLRDEKGNITPYGIPKLEDVLQWAKGKTILILDKKNVPYSRLLKLIEANHAEACVLVSAYHLKEAQYYYKRNPNIIFEAMIKDKKTMKAYEEAGIPWENIIAFTGQPLDASLNARLHKKGVMCMASTMKFQDKEKGRASRIAGYKDIVTNGGIDILLSNEPADLSMALQSLLPESSSKVKFFKKEPI